MTLYHEVAGDGPGVAFLHSSVCDSRMWDAEFAALSDRYRVVRFDLRGFGRSELPPGPFSDLEDVRTVLEHETMTTRRAGGSAEVHDGMPDSYAPSSAPTVYQLLRLVLRGINPMTWRRLLVSAESTVADLHDILQLGFGWSGSISTGS